MASKISPELKKAWDETTAAPDEPDERTAGTGHKAKGPTGDRRHGDRFGSLNRFTDFTAGSLNRGELLTWLVLFRDTRNGTAETSQTDVARRAGVDVRTVKRAVDSLCRRGLLTVVFRGNLHRGPSIYRVHSLEKDAGIR